MRQAPRAAAALAALAACADTSGLTGGEAADAASGDASAEAAAVDGGTGTDASPAPEGGGDAGVPPNLLQNGDFELGCAGWDSVSGAIVTEDTESRSGLRSCRVCTASPFGVGLAQRFVAPVSPGERFAGEIWLRDAPDAAAVDGVSVTLEISDVNGAFVTRSSANPLPPSSAWARTTTLLTVPDGGAKLTFDIELEGASRCALIDDARMTRLP